MNKKFTMMLAAFVAAGYTITAEAGVVKVSKPVSGKSYYITTVATGTSVNYLGKNSGAASNADNAPVLKSVRVNLYQLDTKGLLWTIDGTESNGKITNATLKTDEGYFGFYIGDWTPRYCISGYGAFEVTSNTIKAGSGYLDLSTAGNLSAISSNTDEKNIAYYAKTNNLTGLDNTLLKFGGKYLVQDPENVGKLKLVNDVEYSRLANPTTWSITNGKAEMGETSLYLKVENGSFSLVASNQASILSDYEGALMVSNSRAAAQYVSFAEGQPSLANEEPVENGVESSTITPGEGGLTAEDLVLPSYEAGLPNGVTPPVADWTEESFSLVALVDGATVTPYILKAENGTVTVKEASENVSGNSFFWKYTKEEADLTGSLKSLDGTPFAIDGAYEYELIESNTLDNVYFLYAGGKGYVQFDPATNSLKYATKYSEATAFAAQAEIDNIGVTANDLTEKALGSFSLTYKIDNKEVANLFSNVVAVDVLNGDRSYVAFVVDAPDNLDAQLNLGVQDDANVFNELTFVAISPVKSENFVYEDASNDDGAGYTLTTVKGEDLVDQSKASNNDIAFENIAFAVTRGQTDTKFENLTIAPAYGFYVNGTGDEAGLQLRKKDNVVIAAVKGKNASTFVSTFNTASNAKITNDTEATLTPATAVKYSDFLGTEAKIYNIQFLSTTAADEALTTAEDKETYSECNKYLGAGENTNEFLAQGADFVDLSLPQNQWVVSNMTEENVVTFTNRETAESFSAKLIKVADNEYRLAGFESKSVVKYLFKHTDGKKHTNKVLDASTVQNSFVVKLTAVSSVSKNDGYVSGTLSENDMVKIAFTPTSSVLVEDLYLTVNTTSKATALNKEGAAEFEVIKTAQKKTASHTTPIAVLKDGKPAVNSTVADTLNVVTYAFKQVINDGVYFLDNDLSKVEPVTGNKSENAAQFMIKKLNNGKLALVAYNGEFDETINTEANAFDVNLTEAIIEENHSIYSAASDNEPNAYISFVGQDAAISLPAKSQHVLFNNEGAYMAVNENNAAVIDGPSELKAEYTKEQLTFWLDTTDSEAIVPTFYITKGSKQFMFNAADSLKRYNEGTASLEEVKAYMMPDYQTSGAARAIFRAATLKDSNTLTTSIKGESKDLTAEKGIEAYQYQIVLKDKAVADEYVVRSLVEGKPYLYESNGALGFTDDAKKAIVFNIESTEAPTSNEGVSASDVKVVAQNGSVVVMNAAGKNVVVSTILGQVVVNEVLTSDNATINVPAGIVVVAVEGESFKVNVK